MQAAALRHSGPDTHSPPPADPAACPCRRCRLCRPMRRAAKTWQMRARCHLPPKPRVAGTAWKALRTPRRRRLQPLPARLLRPRRETRRCCSPTCSTRRRQPEPAGRRACCGASAAGRCHARRQHHQQLQQWGNRPRQTAQTAAATAMNSALSGWQRKRRELIAAGDLQHYQPPVHRPAEEAQLLPWCQASLLFWMRRSRTQC